MSVQQLSSLFSKHTTSLTFTTLEGRRFSMSTIRIEKNHFLMLKFAFCSNSFKLCPLVFEKMLFQMGNLAVVYIAKDLESFDLFI